MAPPLCSAALLQAEIQALQRSRANPSPNSGIWGPELPGGGHGPPPLPTRRRRGRAVSAEGPKTRFSASKGPAPPAGGTEPSTRGRHTAGGAWFGSGAILGRLPLHWRAWLATTPVSHRAAWTSSPGPAFAPAEPGGALTSGNRQ